MRGIQGRGERSPRAVRGAEVGGRGSTKERDEPLSPFPSPAPCKEPQTESRRKLSRMGPGESLLVMLLLGCPACPEEWQRCHCEQKCHALHWQDSAGGRPDGWRRSRGWPGGFSLPTKVSTIPISSIHATCLSTSSQASKPDQATVHRSS